MHQTFVRPLEAEDVGITPQLPSPPRREWLELVATGNGEYRADLVSRRSDAQRSRADRSASRQESTAFRWPLVARPEFGGMRPGGAVVSDAAAGMVCGRRLGADAGNIGHREADGPRPAPWRRSPRWCGDGRRRATADRRPSPRRAARSGGALHGLDRWGGLAGAGGAAGFLPEGLRCPRRAGSWGRARGRPGGAIGAGSGPRRSRPRSSSSTCRTKMPRCGVSTRAGTRRNTACARRLALDERSCNAAHCRSARAVRITLTV